MTDPFARTTASAAHQRATEAYRRAEALEQRVLVLADLVGDRPRAHVGRCCLCGWPAGKTARYCRAHQWAAGA